jgi:ubiquinone/menaquinone biosynthesis C-methylase UbiE
MRRAVTGAIVTATPEEDAMTTRPISDTRPAWDTIAAGYDRTNTPSQMGLGLEGLRRAGVSRGTRFLDVAAGSGAVSIPAARLGAEVLATDQSPVMLELLRARARAEGLRLETRVMDGHALAVDDAAFDVAGSQFGVMLFPDLPLGVRELARVVRPGGRVFVTAYGDPHQIEFLGFLVAALQAVRPGFDGPPMDPVPLPFQVSDPARLRAELATAGLRDVRVDELVESTEHADGTALWDWIVWSNPLAGEVLAGLALSEKETAVVRRELERLVRQRAGGEGPATITNPVNIGLGTR